MFFNLISTSLGNKCSNKKENNHKNLLHYLELIRNFACRISTNLTKQHAMKYRIIAVDIDGTLTNNIKEITPKTKEALMEAQRKGVKVILASGRPTYGLTDIANELELAKYDGYVMAYNGGKIRRWSDQEVMFERELEPKFVPELYDAAMEHGFAILTYQGKGIAASDINDKYVKHEAFINKMPLTLYDDFLNQVYYPINKCLIVGEPKALSPFESMLQEQLDGRMNVFRSAAFFLECVPLGVDKATCLKYLIDKIGIKREEVMAIGDGYNDVSMIDFAGLGVAMANAKSQVLQSADYITRSNEEDGVAHAIKKFIL